VYKRQILFNAGDFIQFNQPLRPAGYDEEQWRYDLEHCIASIGEKSVEELTELSIERINGLLSDLMNPPSPEEALKLARLDAPLHPRYTFDWSKIKLPQLLELRNTIADQWENRENGITLTREEKNALEILLIPHRVSKSRIYLDTLETIIEKCLALDHRYAEAEAESSLEQVNQWAGFTIREKAYVYVGGRMGRPEKAKERKMNPYVHSLFPVGNAGGPQRDITRPRRGDKAKVELVNLLCPECGYEATKLICDNCGSKTVLEKQCPRCKTKTNSDTCPRCNINTVGYTRVDIDLREELEKARSYIGGQIPPKIKGVKRLMNAQRIPEPVSYTHLTLPTSDLV